jgi:hypothetical protein
MAPWHGERGAMLSARPKREADDLTNKEQAQNA